MATAPSIAAVASVAASIAAASITAPAGISCRNIASRSDLSGESGNRAGPCPARRGAGYRLAEISVNEEDHDQEKYCQPQHDKACHGPHLRIVQLKTTFTELHRLVHVEVA
jgi:hypothetical protein